LTAVAGEFSDGLSQAEHVDRPSLFAPVAQINAQSSRLVAALQQKLLLCNMSGSAKLPMTPRLWVRREKRMPR
jgi:hypothetical protein